GYFLIDYLGVFGTLTLAIAGSWLIGLAALFVGREGAIHEPAPARSMASNTDKTILFIFALSGMSALAAEAIWTRILKFSLRTDVYAFSVMLSLFLLGLAAGGALAARTADRLERPRLALAMTQIWIGVTALISLRLFRSTAAFLGPDETVITMQD